MFIFGKDHASHDKNLEGLTLRCEDKDIHLNADKTEDGKIDVYTNSNEQLSIK